MLCIALDLCLMQWDQYEEVLTLVKVSIMLACYTLLCT